MKLFKFVVPAFVLATGLLINSSMSFAKPEFVKQTKKACTYCHPTAKGGKDLKDAGKYFKEKKTLEGYEEKK